MLFFLHDKSNWILFWVWIILFFWKKISIIFLVFFYLDKKFFVLIFFYIIRRLGKNRAAIMLYFFLNRSENNIKRSTLLFLFRKSFKPERNLLMRVLGFFFLVKCKDFHNNIEGSNILKMFCFFSKSNIPE